MHDEWHARISGRLRGGRHPVDDGVVEELAQHAEAAYQAARAEGLDPAEATGRVEALIRDWMASGAVLRHRASTTAAVEPPPASAGSRFAGLLHDMRYAWRLSWRTPAPTIIAALTMALGIAATTTLFSVTWSVLMKPLPWAEPDTLVRVRESREGATRTFPDAVTNGTYLAWAADPQTIEAIGAYSPDTVTLTGAGDPQRVQVVSATASVFAVTRAVPVRGALYTAADEAAGERAVISHAFWHRQFGGAEDIVGRTLTLDGKTRTIVGVMAPDFGFPDRESIAWVPKHVLPSRPAGGGSWMQLFNSVARLKPGVTPAQASEEATARARSAPDPGLVVMAVFGSKGASRVEARSVLEAATADVRGALWVLLGAVGLLLMTAAANIASVQLARAAMRRRELAIRVSLGASGARLARQLVLESVVIGAVGGATGLALASLIHTALPWLLPPDFPRAAEITFDWRAAAFAIAVAALTSLAVGLVPAIQARRLTPRSGMIEDAAATGTAFNRSSTARVRAAIMAGQVAVACLLLVGAALLGRTFLAMLQVDRGYDASNVLTAVIASPPGLFSAERRTTMVDRVLERLRSHPDVLYAAAANNLPLAGGEMLMALTLPPGTLEAAGQPVQVGFRVVSSGYFEAMGIGLASGRVFSDRDTSGSVPVLVANRAFADRYLPADAVGRRLDFDIYDRKGWEIAGVVDNVLMRASVTEPPRPEIFVAYPQTPTGIEQPMLVVRTRSDPSGLMTELRGVVQAIEPLAALESVRTMDDRVLGSLARPRLYAVLLTGFAGFALVIAGVGLFGVLSYAVAQRSKELGVRTALGARPAQIVGLVVREGLVIAGIGVVAGLVLAIFASRWLTSFLYGVSPVDPWLYLAVAGLLLGIAALASAVPARRAAKIDPLIVLKSS